MCEPPATYIFAWRPQKANYCDGPGLFWTDKLTLGMANCVFFSSFSIYNFRSDQVWHLPRSSSKSPHPSCFFFSSFWESKGRCSMMLHYGKQINLPSFAVTGADGAKLSDSRTCHLALLFEEATRQGVFKGLQTPRLKRWGAEARDFECNSLGYWCDTTLVHPFSRNPLAPQCSGLMYNLNNWKFPLRMMLFQSLDIIGGLSPGHKFKWKLFGVTQPNHDGIHISAFCVPISLGYSI